MYKLQRLWGEAEDRDIKVDCIILSNGRYVLSYTRMNITRTFCELVEDGITQHDGKQWVFLESSMTVFVYMTQLAY